MKRHKGDLSQSGDNARKIMYTVFKYEAANLSDDFTRKRLGVELLSLESSRLMKIRKG